MADEPGEPSQEPPSEAADGSIEEPAEAEGGPVGTQYMRQPIVSVLGHVDHGKTSLLDRVRGGSVAAREPGAITQHIGATEVPRETLMKVLEPIKGAQDFRVPGLLFIDTPGHASFNTLRARGGALADIAVLVVDLNEGLMPQTMESIRILRANKTPFVVAANKLDLVPMYESAEDAPFAQNIKQQNEDVRQDVDRRLYDLVGRLYDQKLPADRYDRIQDFTKSVAVVPVSAKTGEGIPDLLLVLVGLAQKFLEQRLQTLEEGPGIGTVLEVKEERGLGLTLDAIVYSGTLRNEDQLAIHGKNGPVVTGIRALLKPRANDEIRDPRQAFERVELVRAAAGVKINAPDLEDVLPGAPLRGIRPEDDLDEVLEEMAKEAEVQIPLDDDGVVIKADTLGSLEALAAELRARDVRIRWAGVGPISRREIVTAATTEDPLQRVLVAFNVRMLPDAVSERQERGLTVVSSDVIYTVLEDFEAWQKETLEAKDKAERVDVVHPCMLRFLPDHTFRVKGPAVIGVRVLAGQLTPGLKLLKEDGRTFGPVKSIQAEGNTVPEAHQGQEVAIAIEGVTVGRQIKEEDILYLDIPGGDAKQLYAMEKLSADERDVLEKVTRIKRQTEKFWGM